MAPAPPSPRPDSGEEVLTAVFDLDGTLVRGDSLIPFLIGFGRRFGRAKALVRLPLVLGAYASGLFDDRRAKERCLVDFLGGARLADVEEYGREFVAAWVERRTRPPLVEILRRHQRAGHRTVLVSASPSLYVREIARRFGFDDVVCTEVMVRNGVVDGRIVGQNCKGPEKVLMLERRLGRRPTPSVGYGDSKSDLPLLTWLDEGYLVSSGGGLKRVERAGRDDSQQPRAESS